jgi:hypothetical protein
VQRWDLSKVRTLVCTHAVGLGAVDCSRSSQLPCCHLQNRSRTVPQADLLGLPLPLPAWKKEFEMYRGPSLACRALAHIVALSCNRDRVPTSFLLLCDGECGRGCGCRVIGGAPHVPLVALAQLQAGTVVYVWRASYNPGCAPRRRCHAALRLALKAPNIVAKAPGMTTQTVSGAAR